SATNIAANYLLPFDIPGFEAKARKILKDLKEDLGWMYQTYHIAYSAQNKHLDRFRLNTLTALN
ncbi:MAG: hypothetical protein PHU76_07935, partial [Synergistaceae bacterium]|nr:hypothetical protein [Synergistaceae bacterium]